MEMRLLICTDPHFGVQRSKMSASDVLKLTNTFMPLSHRTHALVSLVNRSSTVLYCTALHPAAEHCAKSLAPTPRKVLPPRVCFDPLETWGKFRILPLGLQYTSTLACVAYALSVQ